MFPGPRPHRSFSPARRLGTRTTFRPRCAVTAPAAARPHKTSGGSRSAEAKSQTERRVRAAHMAMMHCNVEMSNAKTRRLVRRFEREVNRNGWTFHEFLFNAANLTLDQRRSVMCHRTLARLLSYCDPTGERAVNNVLGQRGY